jgi:membrane protein
VNRAQTGARLWAAIRAVGAGLVAFAAEAWRLLGLLATWLRENVTWRRIRAILRIGRSALARYWADDGDALAGYVAYATFLSMFPFAIFAVALAGAALTPEDIDAIVGALFDLAPEHIARTLEPAIRGVAIENGRTLITGSALFALWTASNAIESLRVGFDRAYRPARERGFAMRRLRALAFVIFASLMFGLLGFLVIAAPLVIRIAEAQLGFFTPYGLGLVRYTIGVALFVVLLMQMHLFLPSERPVRRRLWPGVVVSVTLWAIGATAFSVYLSYAPNFAVTYGAFTGVIVTLLFFYLTGAAIIFGAEVNAVLMRFRGRDMRKPKRLPSLRKVLRHGDDA